MSHRFFVYKSRPDFMIITMIIITSIMIITCEIFIIEDFTLRNRCAYYILQQYECYILLSYSTNTKNDRIFLPRWLLNCGNFVYGDKYAKC